MRLRMLACALAAALLLSACGVSAPAAPTPQPTERPTSTPRPTVTPRPSPTQAPEPTRAPDPTRAPEPTPTTGGGLAEVRMDDLQLYTHTGGLFVIKQPTEWTIDDQSGEDYAAVFWADPTNNALLFVNVTTVPEQLTQEDIATRLEEYIDIFKDEPDFSMDPPEPQADGSVRIIWSYTAEADTGYRGTLLANSFMQQDGDKLAVVTFGVPDEQFDQLIDPLNEVINSFHVFPTPPFSAETPLISAMWDFSDDDGWTTANQDDFEATIEDGTYAITIKVSDSFYVSSPDIPLGEDFLISAHVLPDEEARAGLAVRQQKNDSGNRSFYACWIDDEQNYGCFVSVDGSWTTLEEASADVILPGEMNRLTLSAVGSELQFSVNGTLLASFSDDQVIGGYASLYVENFENTAGAIFDNAVVIMPE